MSSDKKKTITKNAEKIAEQLNGNRETLTMVNHHLKELAYYLKKLGRVAERNFGGPYNALLKRVKEYADAIDDIQFGNENWLKLYLPLEEMKSGDNLPAMKEETNEKTNATIYIHGPIKQHELTKDELDNIQPDS